MHCLSLKLLQDVYFCGLLVKGKKMSQVFLLMAPLRREFCKLFRAQNSRNVCFCLKS